MKTTSKHCTRQPCPTPYECGDKGMNSCPPCNSLCGQGRFCPATKREAAHHRAAHAFCTAEADELDEFAAGNARWIEPKHLWPVWVLGAVLAVIYGLARFYFTKT